MHNKHRPPSLTIMVPTVVGREKQFEELRDEIFRQGQDYFDDGSLGFITLKDNKEMTIGEKRRRLYASAMGLYGVQWDDDDGIHPNGIELIMDALMGNPGIDCVTYQELCIFDGKKVESSDHSRHYPDWRDNFAGFNHVRTPFFKDVIRMDLVRQAIIPDIRFGEDHAFAKSIHPLLKTEFHINEFIYIYRHNSSPHNERYGIK